MTELPRLLRRLPYVFYAFALILGGWRFFNEWTLLEASYSQMSGINFETPSMNMAHAAGRSSAIYWGFTEAAYMIANGATLQVFIAIYDKMKGPEA